MKEAATILLIMAAVLCSAAGVLFLNEATAGVGIIALGCVAAILARIAQAGRHHDTRHHDTRQP